MKSGAALHVVVPAVVPVATDVHESTSWRSSMWVEWVTPGILDMTTRSMVSTPVHVMGNREPGLMISGALTTTGRGKPLLR